MTKKRKAYRRGVIAEYCAALLLIIKGYGILKMRYKTPHGEIDIIAKKKDLIVFVEVKARQSQNDALYAVDARTQRRIEQAALDFISKNKNIKDHQMRFDVIAFGSLWPFSARHLDNAWQARS